MREWEVPGYELVELLGYGATGEVWRARTRTGLVALRRLAGTDHEAMGEVRRWATVVRSLPTRHVVRVRSITRAQGDEVLVLDHADGGSLEALLVERGTLTPGEVVTVLAPLAEALAAAHAHGLTHRRLRASRVLLTGEGMPLLDGLGLDPLHDPKDSLDPTGALGASADVWALGDLGRRMLAGDDPALPETVPVPLAEALAAATDDDPLARPSAEELAARLLAACPAAPLQGLPSRPELPAAPVPRRARRPALIALVAVLGLSVVGAVGWTWGSHVAQAGATVPQAHAHLPQPAQDWAAVVRQLDAARSRAFSTGDPGLLGQVYAPGSPLREQDEAALADLRSRGATARGLTHRLVAVTASTITDGRVSLVVTQSLSPYQLVDERGVVLERHTAGPVLQVRVRLAREPSGWRIDLVETDTQVGPFVS